jgi:hypothetical protein
MDMTSQEEHNGTDNKPVNMTAFEYDDWPFTICTFEDQKGYFVQTFLKNMPVSHTYHVDNQTYAAKVAAGENPLSKLIDLAKSDIVSGLYRKWILHWASQ